MQVYTRYKVARARRPLRAGFYWALALAGLGFLGWVWWYAGKETESKLSAGRKESAPSSRAPRRSASPAVVGPAPARPPPERRTVPAPDRGDALPPVVTPGPYDTRPGMPVEVGALAQSFTSRAVRDALEAQLALGRCGISSGSLDGVAGGQTRAALRAFQDRERLPVTGDLDPATRARLRLEFVPLTTYVVTTNDLTRLLPLSRTWLGKSLQERLDFETILELVAERARSHPNLIRRLNPGVDWSNVLAGVVLQVPNAVAPTPGVKAAFLRIRLGAKTLQAFDANTNLLAHFPCSIARQVEKRPVGQLHVAVIVPNPDYTFNPEVFPESAEGRQLGRKLRLPPGPNNPVGIAWIGLDRPGYGIHGTPRPEEVGRTESHGCFRLANWDAEHLLQLASVGLPVVIEP